MVRRLARVVCLALAVLLVPMVPGSPPPGVLWYVAAALAWTASLSALLLGGGRRDRAHASSRACGLFSAVSAGALLAAGTPAQAGLWVLAEVVPVVLSLLAGSTGARGEVQVLGHAGAGLADGSAREAFGDRNVRYGIKGERMVSAALARGLCDAGVDAVVVNSLRFPGSAVADVDAAVLVGSWVFPVDAKYYARGTWSMDHQGLITDEHGKRPRQNHMGAALRGLRAQLPGARMPVAYVAVVNDRADALVARARRNRQGVVMGSPEDVVADIVRRTRFRRGAPDPVLLEELRAIQKMV